MSRVGEPRSVLETDRHETMCDRLVMMHNACDGGMVTVGYDGGGTTRHVEIDIDVNIDSNTCG